MANEFLVQLERALDSLLDAAVQHDAVQQTLSSGSIAAYRLKWFDIQVAPENNREDIIRLLHDPVGEALRQAICRFGQHLFELYGSTAGMRYVADRLLSFDPVNRVLRAEVIDVAWTGIGGDGDRWSA